MLIIFLSTWMLIILNFYIEDTDNFLIIENLVKCLADYLSFRSKIQDTKCATSSKDGI